MNFIRGVLYCSERGSPASHLHSVLVNVSVNSPDAAVQHRFSSRTPTGALTSRHFFGKICRHNRPLLPLSRYTFALEVRGFILGILGILSRMLCHAVVEASSTVSLRIENTRSAGLPNGYTACIGS